MWRQRVLQGEIVEDTLDADVEFERKFDLPVLSVIGDHVFAEHMQQRRPEMANLGAPAFEPWEPAWVLEHSQFHILELSFRAVRPVEGFDARPNRREIVLAGAFQDVGNQVVQYASVQIRVSPQVFRV